MARKAEVKVRITGDSKSAERAAKKTEGAFSRMGSTIKRNALAISGVIGTLLVAFRQMDKEARLQGQTEALRRNLAAQGVALDDFMAKMKEAADSQLSAAQTIEAAGKAMVLGIPAEKMAELMEVAKASAIALGTEVGTAFEDLTLGLARRSLPILDNLGFTTTDLTKAKEDFAAAAGKTVEALSGEETAAALLNGVLTIGKERVKEYGDAQSEAARAINQSKAAMADLSRVAGVGLNAVMLLAGASAAGVAKAYNQLGQAASSLDASFRRTQIAIFGTNERWEQLAVNAEYNAEMFRRAAAANTEFAQKLTSGAETMAKMAAGMQDASDGAENLAAKLGGAGDAADTAAGHFTTAEEAALGLGNALGEVTSIELELQIEKINEALAESTAEMDKNGAEYIRLERIASAKIESLRARIRNLRDGLGDLTTATKESSDEWNSYAVNADRAAVATDRLTTSQRTNTQAVRENREAQTGVGRFTGFPVGPGTGGTFTYWTPGRVVQDPSGRLRVT